jgi:hypothetical protein
MSNNLTRPFLIKKVRVDDSQIEQLVQDKIQSLSLTLESSSSSKGKLAVLMCDKRRGSSPLRPVSARPLPASGGGWFGLGTSSSPTATESAPASCWEQWIFSFTLTQARGEREELEARKRMAQDLQGLLELISTRSLETLDHIPPLTSSDAFPFQVCPSVSFCTAHKTNVSFDK